MNRYNSAIHHRSSIRLKGYDYAQAGMYFVTICVQDKICRFGHIKNDEMVLNEYGAIAYDEWPKLADRFHNFELDVFQIMPNHMHGIIVLNTVGAGFTPALIGPAPALNEPAPAPNIVDDVKKTGSWAGASPAPTIGDIVGAYKSLVANACLDIYKAKNEMMGKLWQPNYYEHIIRTDQAYQTISEYIINNPAKWMDDKYYKI
jgi:putative transposase